MQLEVRFMLTMAVSASISLAGSAGCGGNSGAGGTGAGGSTASSGAPAGSTSTSSSGGAGSSASAGTGGSSSTGSTSASAGTGGSSSTGSTSASSGGCTSMPTDNAPFIHDTDDTSQPMPPMSTAMGGTIESGTYFQTQQLYYQGSTNYSPTDVHQTTAIFDASQGTITLLIGPNEFEGTYSTSGTVLTMNFTCPMQGQLMDPYTYAGGTLTLYDYTKNEVNVLQKQ
jgi:hypothetical protein